MWAYVAPLIALAILGLLSNRPADAINVPAQQCMGATTTATPFNLASTTALKVITKATSKNVYICHIDIVSAAANNVALIAGTKTTNDCDTSTAGLAGGTTAATGWNFAANGGLTAGNGTGMVAATASTGLDVCLLASGSGQVSGVLVWAQF